MNTRRRFLGSLLLAPAISLESVQAQDSLAESAHGESREAWVQWLRRVAEPVVSSLAANRLKLEMPVECPNGKREARANVTHLEAVGRTLCGLAPWLQASGLGPSEEAQRDRMAMLVRQGLTNAMNPASPDHLSFTASGQNLVDAAFLALGLSRARKELWDKADPLMRERLISALASTRRFKPGNNNWLLFSAIIEAFLASVAAEWRAESIETALRSHETWYKGDGAYGDGPEFHWDYYNSFVIHPLLLEVLELLQPVTERWAAMFGPMLARARRYAAVQERLIAPDGSFPPLGRSLTYRCGAFHHLAAMALRRQLPENVAPAQIRGALAAVIQRTIGASGTFDDKGWLKVGLAGAQPGLAEVYISTGSLYLCTTAFLPLGLNPADPFWSSPALPWTAKKIWTGADSTADHALS